MAAFSLQVKTDRLVCRRSYPTNIAAFEKYLGKSLLHLHVHLHCAVWLHREPVLCTNWDGAMVRYSAQHNFPTSRTRTTFSSPTLHDLKAHKSSTCQTENAEISPASLLVYLLTAAGEISFVQLGFLGCFTRTLSEGHGIRGLKNGE